MSGVNKAILVGRLGRDPEVKFASSGNAVCNFSVATSEKWKGKDGKEQERTEWHNVVVFGKLAEICGEHLAKGREVYVEGRIQTDEYEGKDGQKKKSTKIVAQQVTFIGSKGQATRENKPEAKKDTGFDYGPPPMADDTPF